MKRFAVLLLALAMAVCCAMPAFAAGTIEVTEDVSVTDTYDWTRFKGQNVAINVYNWGEYISNGSDDSVDVVAAFEKLTGIKVNYTTFDSNESLYAKAQVRRSQLRCGHSVGLHGGKNDRRGDAQASELRQYPELQKDQSGIRESGLRPAECLYGALHALHHRHHL